MLNHSLRVPLRANRGGEIFKGDLVWEAEKWGGRENSYAQNIRKAQTFMREKFEETQWACVLGDREKVPTS